MTKVTMVQPHLSFSSVNQFASCPRSWYAQRVLGKRQPQGSAASFGLACEAVVTKALKAFDEKAARELAEGKTPEDRLPALDDPMWREIFAAAAKYLATEGAWNDSMPGVLVAQRKIELTPEVWGTMADMYGAHGEIHLPIIGYIDWLHVDPTGLRRTIADFKTTTKSGCQISWVIQTLLYALAVRAQECQIHVLVRPADRPTKKPRKPDWLPNFQTALYKFRPTDAAYRWCISWIGYYAEQMRAAEQASSIERLAACGGYWCGWCPVKDDCEAHLLGSLVPFGGSKTAAGASEENEA